MLIKKTPHKSVFFSRMRRCVTAESIPTKFCTSTLWGGCSNIFDMTSKLVEGFRRGVVRKWASPIALALASNTAYCTTAHRRELMRIVKG